jgi:peptidyl-prolyl cis-trans isomerase SurA
MIRIKKFIFLILVFFTFTNLGFSKISLQIVMKIDNEIVTSYDIEQEVNYLVALNSQLKEVNLSQLKQIAKRSITKEIIRKNEILKYKQLDIKNSNIDPVLNSLARNLNFSNQLEFVEYLKKFNVSLDDLKNKILIENEWKALIYSRYIKSVRIDKNELNNQLEKIINNEFQFEYDLSEIIFEKQNNISLEELTNNIQESIKNIGFQNTANLYSISDSSKIGGKIGWVKSNNLAKPILEAIQDLKENEYSQPIQIGNNFLILKMNKIKKTSLKINKDKELEKMIVNETTKQLNKYSNIFYNKIKLNSKIYEY